MTKSLKTQLREMRSARVMTEQEARDDEREARAYVTALNEHAEEQFSRQEGGNCGR